MTRDEVIRALERHLKTVVCKGCPYIEEPECEVKLCDDAIALIKAEPKRGRWEGWAGAHWTGKFEENGDPEYKPHTVYRCSECGRRTIVREAYCPNCGAKMEVDHED